jgi:SprT protein
MIEPIGKTQQQTVIAASNSYLRRAEDIFGRPFASVGIAFDLSGRCAGMLKVSRDSCQVRYNPWIFAKYFEDNLSNTVPHEIAHYVNYRLYPRRRIRPHGKEWKKLMAAFGADASVTGNYDLTDVPQRPQRRFAYQCQCSEHQFTTRRHNQVQKGSYRYRCRHCSTDLLLAQPLPG